MFMSCTANTDQGVMPGEPPSLVFTQIEFFKRLLVCARVCVCERACGRVSSENTILHHPTTDSRAHATALGLCCYNMRSLLPQHATTD